MISLLKSAEQMKALELIVWGGMIAYRRERVPKRVWGLPNRGILRRPEGRPNSGFIHSTE
jgi:hypothetical protein